jgi:hypothetical protein
MIVLQNPRGESVRNALDAQDQAGDGVLSECLMLAGQSLSRVIGRWF